MKLSQTLQVRRWRARLGAARGRRGVSGRRRRTGRSARRRASRVVPLRPLLPGASLRLVSLRAVSVLWAEVPDLCGCVSAAPCPLP